VLRTSGDETPGARLLDLVQVMDTLRQKCPWDARQSHESLTPFLLEETYEAVDALTAGDQEAVREELGDVLLQVVFHARVAQERTDGTGYTIDDVADGIIGKLTRRHPHVFGDVSVSGPDDVKRNWDAIKAAERAAASSGEPVSALDGVPLHQPALSLAAQLLRRAERAGAPPELAEAPAGLADAHGHAEVAGAEVAGAEVAGAEVAGAEVAGAEVAGAEVAGAEVAGAEAAGAEAAGADTAGADTAGSRPGTVGPDAASSGTPAAAGTTVRSLGQELFDLVRRARAEGLDPELELRAATLAYADRVRAWERDR
jgi:NTP pyrophosphatase (non-canonical NTP hydrolase)